MSTILFARCSGFTYVHTPFRAIEHNYLADPEWVEKWEEFFSLGHGEVHRDDLDPARYESLDLGISIVPAPFDLRREECVGKLVVIGHCLNFSDRNVAKYDLVRDDLRARYWLHEKPKIVAGRSIVVAVHVRRGDAFDSMLTPNEVLCVLLGEIERSLAGEDFEVFLISQGEEGDFPEFRGRVKFCLNEDPFVTYHRMVVADVLVTAKSSFSYSAAVLSKGVVLYVPFWHAPLPGWISVGGDGSIDGLVFAEALAQTAAGRA